MIRQFTIYTLLLSHIGWGQGKIDLHKKHYLSASISYIAPLGVFDDDYKSGISLNAIAHLKWLRDGAEMQIVSGYDHFPQKNNYIFGHISVIPLKMGILQMLSKEFYIYGRAGIVGAKDEISKFSIRPSIDGGIGLTIKKISIDLGWHGWFRKRSIRMSDYFSAGVVVPFRSK